MFKTLLYPTDFSDVSKKALDYIRQLKEGGAESVIVLHVINERGLRIIGQYAPKEHEAVEQKIKTDRQQELKVIEDDLKRSGFKVKTILRIGNPVLEILRAEEKEDVSVVVIGSHGKSNLEEIFLGSVSEKVARKCKNPILIIKR